MLVLINVIDKHLILRCIAPRKVSLLFCLFHSLLKVSVKKIVFINFFMYFYGNSYFEIYEIKLFMHFYSKSYFKCVFDGDLYYINKNMFICYNDFIISNIKAIRSLDRSYHLP